MSSTNKLCKKDLTINVNNNIDLFIQNNII